jgi:hypothetical protein
MNLYPKNHEFINTYYVPVCQAERELTSQYYLKPVLYTELL